MLAILNIQMMPLVFYSRIIIYILKFKLIELTQLVVDPAGIKDVLMESAITTIQDCEDSIQLLMQTIKFKCIEIGLV